MSVQWPSILIVGCGSMGGGLMRALIAAGCPAALVRGVDKSSELCASLQHELGCMMDTDLLPDTVNVEVVILATKPQQAAEVLPRLGGALAPGTVLVSIMAGIDLLSLRKMSGHSLLVRAMPNLPVIVQSGVTALVAEPDFADDMRQLVARVFASSGSVVWLDSEADMDIVTAVSGSGPAYFFYMMECLAKSAEEAGMNAAVARSLVLNTALGAARLALADDMTNPARLRASVTSPGGTTEAAMKQFELAGMADTIDRAVKAAKDRSVELRLGDTTDAADSNGD